jgi:hypothetical protein
MAHETVDYHDRIVRDPEISPGKPEVAGTADFVSPQELYREATRREDVRRILDALAK